MKVYELDFRDDMPGVFRVSVVKDPAVEATLLHFNKEEGKPLYFANEEKRVVYSVAMRPNKLIPRSNINGEPANVYYTAETVERLQQNYFKNNYNVSTNINHEQNDTQGIYPFESWVVKNPANDKANELGLEVMQGDWVMAYKVDNDEVWGEIKKGNIDGLSVEMYVGYKEDNNFNNVKMTSENKEKGLFELLKAFFVGEAPKEKTPEELAAEEEAKKKEEEMAVEPVVEEPMPEDVQPKEEEKNLEEQLAELEAKNADLLEKLNKLEAEKVKAEAELQTMKAEKPAVEAIKNVPLEVKKTYEEMSNYEKLKFNRENKK